MFDYVDNDQLFRIRDVVKITGLSKSTIYQLLSAKKFPPPVKISRRAVAWRRSDLVKWISELRTGSTEVDDE